MGRVGAFLQVDRVDHAVRPAAEAVADFEEFAVALPLEAQREQASRCMNCGVAFCQSGVALGGSAHAVGCPLHNLIPETNDLLYRGRIEDAVARMALTNPFPEFTGRVCPAPCEVACNLGLRKAPVSINDNERAISDAAWELGIDPLPAPAADAPLASVVGSGPAGLAVAWELARRGWRVRVYEKADRPGGLLMYGIPNMKLPKWVIERRVELMRKSGIEFFCGVDVTASVDEVGTAIASTDATAADTADISTVEAANTSMTWADKIAAESDAVVIATGAGVARDVALPGRDLSGIHFALDYLSEVTSALLDERAATIDAAGKDVVVIGGGDTGNDCVACALRQGAASVTQVIRAARAPESCNVQEVWPDERTVFTQGYGQREAEAIFGADPRIFSMDTIAFSGSEADADAVAQVNESAVAQVHIQQLSYEGGRHLVEDTEATIPAQLVLIAKGFTGADESVFEAFGVETPGRDASSHVLAAHSATSSAHAAENTTHAASSTQAASSAHAASCAAGDANKTAEDARDAPDEPAIFVAGDARLGSTLVVNAIADALECVDEITHT